MSGLTPYLHFAGTAREALTFYHGVFGGELVLHSFGDFGRDDGSSTLIAHGVLQGRVTLYAADAAPTEPTLEIRGMLFSLLGTATPAELERWFAALSEGGDILDPFQLRSWGDHDGRVQDQFGLTWLIGYEG